MIISNFKGMQFLHSLTRHGRSLDKDDGATSTYQRAPTKEETSSLLSSKVFMQLLNSPFYLSKSYFWSFYAVAVGAGLLVVSRIPLDPIAICYLIHCIRRFLETVILFKSKSKMNLIHLGMGLTFYPAIWVIIYNDSKFKDSINKSPFVWIKMISLLCFMMVQYGQYQCHLAMSRNLNRQILPAFWMFRLVVCPNFGLECLIYLSLFGCLQSLISFEALVFVVINQTMSAVDRQGSYKGARWIPRYAIFYSLI